jgi:hypothetical protein
MALGFLRAEFLVFSHPQVMIYFFEGASHISADER